MKQTSQLSPTETKELLKILEERFLKNMNRHENYTWNTIEEKLINTPEKLWSLNQMEITGGEPDVVSYQNDEGKLFFFDCSLESPVGRRSLCYDNDALEKRKLNKPKDSACNLALAMGISLLDENQYRFLQTVDTFDLKTSSWILTPQPIRALGGALFCDRRYNHIFTYHNGADSYYSARGFRGCLSV